MQLTKLLLCLVAGALAFATAASAQSASFMRNDCADAGRAYFRDFNASTDTKYEGQRSDGTHLVIGRIHLRSRTEDFSCSYARDGKRMSGFFAEGRWRDNPLPGAGTPPPAPGKPSGSVLQLVTGVPANDVLNMRSAPGTQAKVVGTLKNGDIVLRLKCKTAEAATWCEVRNVSDVRSIGWVNARYLGKIDGSSADKPKPPTPGTGQITTTFVRFPHGVKTVELKEELPSRAVRRYVLRVRSGQELRFRVETKAQQFSWRIVSPNGGLVDQNSASREFRGKLRQSGEYVIEVSNGGSRSHGYNVMFRLD
ncbi:SH3 domain-containing protein [Maliponia aquimaris]|nr:SH3 domain-containing protein [Maliponia aquimaris]